MILLKLKYKLQWVDMYVGHFVCNIFHELSHYVIAFLCYSIGLLNKCPKLVIFKHPTIELRDDYDGYYMVEAHMYVNVQYVGNKPITLLLITIMPAITTILLFWFSPWYLWLYYLSNLGTLWLSIKDSKDIVNYLKQIQEIYFTKQLQNENNSSNPKPADQD